MATTTLSTVQVDDLTIAYRELGDGPPVLLLHGWPTSSFLWRDVMEPIAQHNRVIALDLPGFGGSSKPQGARYTFGFFERAIEGTLDALGIEQVAIGAHDIGGPVAVHWALEHRDRVTRMALLNTLVYPEFSQTVIEFVTVLSTPDRRHELTSPEGLAAAMRLGVENDLDDEVVAAVAEPFGDDASRRSLADAGIGLEIEAFTELGKRVGELDMPVRLIYGEQDRILPDVAETMARLERELPDARSTSLPQAGHFLQEDAPDEVGRLLAEFFA